MSRALTVYVKEKDTPEVADVLARVMASQGCSEPVARNLMKYGKLGIGPLAGEGEGERKSKDRDQGKRESTMYTDVDRKVVAPTDRKNRLREIERKAAEAAALAEEEMEKEETAKREERMRKRSSIIRLGPVMAREEKVEPFAKKKEADGQPSDLEDALAKELEERRIRAESLAKKETEKRRLQEESRRQGKKKKKRRRGRDGDAEDDEDGSEEEDRGDEPSPGADRSKTNSSGSLMTEDEVRAMVNKGRHKSERGSARAQARIQKEKNEWETAKASNAEFWKAPKFCLCYSAETGKKRSY